MRRCRASVSTSSRLCLVGTGSILRADQFPLFSIHSIFLVNTK